MVLVQGNRLLQRMALFQASAMSWPASPGMGNPTVVKKVIRLDVPIEKFPNEEKLKDKPGYEHLNDPLHLLLEAEFPEDIIDSRLDHAVALLENLLKPVV
ncbi:K Homology domain-containing protein [Artemisia annua]|uniref:K Homology domain-containing protein n=1 Tax=Artemisia annua TaxID=35608 RepID=A0A2U1PHU7_ARTAN|nr:K Homology domain-containing protein [Artemisia annua]